VLVLTDGSDALGARRWIDLGFTTLQPSEFTKIALIMVLAHLVDRCRNYGYTNALIVVMVVACAIPIGLIVVEPDLGTTIIAVFGILAVLWFGGVPKRVVVVLALGLVVLAILAIFGSGFRQSRITSWLDPWSDPQGRGYQLLNSYYAFGGGGVFGVGLGLSRQKFSWLPQSENDFIFAIVGEELGLVGALIVVLLFVGLVFMALKIAQSAPDSFGAMLAGASGILIGLQAFLNMLCVVGALPITGKPLPFFSAGGSSIITTMILVGLILSVSLRSTEANVHDFRREQFTVVRGSSQSGIAPGTTSSVLSRLPNPAALVGALISKQQAPEKAKQSSNAVPSGKIIPISRGRAEKLTRERQGLQQERAPHPVEPPRRRSEAPISMTSLRRNRVR
jgi:cell division protein FtsW